MITTPRLPRMGGSAYFHLMFDAMLSASFARRPASAADELTKGRWLRDKGAWRRAERKFRKALSLARRDGERRCEAQALHLLSSFRLMNRQTQDAKRLAAEAAVIYREIGENGGAVQATRLAQTAEALARL